jgi:hypothetical protein
MLKASVESPKQYGYGMLKNLSDLGFNQLYDILS